MGSKAEKNWEIVIGPILMSLVVAYSKATEANLFNLQDFVKIHPDLICLIWFLNMSCLIGGGILTAVGMQKYRYS